MANTITSQTLANGPRNLVLKIHIDGDGSGEETATQIVDVSAFGASEVVIVGLHSTFSGFIADLLWDATTDVPILTVPDYEYNLDNEIRHFGGFPNNAGAGMTGDVLITTVGLGAGDHGTLVLEMVKK